MGGAEQLYPHAIRTKMTPDTQSLESVRPLLDSVFGGTRYTLRYLEWLYRDNPDGWVFSAEQYRDGRCQAHCALVPQAWQQYGSRNTSMLALALNIAVSPESRGEGWFTKLTSKAIEAASERGVGAAIGVANAQATPGWLGRLGFKLLRPLPARIKFLIPSTRGVRSIVATPDWMDSEEFNRLFASLPTPSGWSRLWDAAHMRWRLHSPLGPYHVHIDDRAILISRRIIQAGVPFSAVLKILPRTDNAKVDPTPLLRAAASVHSTPLMVYAGWNNSVSMKGIRLPRFVMPSPLNLVLRPLAADAPGFEDELPDILEFLDFDAY